MKHKLIFLVAVFAVFSFTTSTSAFQATFTPRVSGTQEYTSNVFLSDDDEKDDFITKVSAGFTADLLGQNSGMEVSYDPTYQKYDDFDENDGWRHLARLRGWSNLTQRTQFELRNRFLRAQDPLDEEDILVLRGERVVQEGDPTVRQDRRTFYRNTARARITHQFGRDDSIYARFLYGLLRNNDPQVEDNDRISPNIGLNYWFGPKWGLQSSFTYTRGLFDRDNDFEGEGTDDFNNYAGFIRFIRRTKTRFAAFFQYDHLYRDFDGDVGDNNDYMLYAPSVGFQYRIERDLVLRLGATYYYQSIDDDDDNQGLAGNGQANKTWNFRRGLINLTGLTGVGQSNFGAQNIGLERYAAIQGSARYDFARTVSGDINARYRYSDSIGDTDQGDDDDTGNNVHRINAGAGLTFTPLKWMSIRLGYRFRKVNSDEEEDEYDEHRGLLRITLTPSQPYRYQK